MIKSYEYDVKEIEKLTASTASADIVVFPSSSSKIVVEVDTDEEDYEPLVEEGTRSVSFKFQKGPKGTVIDVPFLNELFRRGPRVDSVKIGVPQKILQISLATASGEIDVRDLDLDSLKITQVSGDTNISSVLSSDISINSVSGDCDIRDSNYRDGAFKTVSGDMIVRKLTPMERKTKLSSVSGDVTLVYAGKPKLDISISAVSGEVVSDLPLIKKEKRHYVTSEEAPEEFLTMSTVSGDVSIKVQSGAEPKGAAIPRQRRQQEEDVKEKLGLDEEIFDEETQKVLKMLKEGKLTEEYAKQMLEMIGYSQEEIDQIVMREVDEQDRKPENGSGGDAQ